LQHIVPNCVKVTGNNPTVIKTQKLAANIRIKQELKFLYKNKSALNQQLYNSHLQAAAYWGNTWYITENDINENLKYQLDQKYDTLTKKTKQSSKSTKTKTYTRITCT
jgi:formylmethanofuran dehydrogenase subunit A